MRETPQKSKVFYVTQRIVMERRFEVLAPTARQALVPLETLYDGRPYTLMTLENGYTNVVQKRRRFYAGKPIRRNK